MPELPEVETVKRGLEKRVVGLCIASIDVRVPKIFIGNPNEIAGQKIIKIWRRSKVLGLDLADGEKIDRLPRSSQGLPFGARNDKTILIHLKMTGQLVFQGPDEKIKVVGGHPQKSYNDPLPHKHTHIIFNFTDGSKLYFNDLRKFGWVNLVETKRVFEVNYLKNIGIEPFGAEYELENFQKLVKMAKNRKIKEFLLDQTKIAGLGNIYTDEVLYEAGVLPYRLAGELKDDEVRKIFDTIPKVLQKALDCGGTSDSTFIGVDGERGSYLKCAFVYHQETDPKGHKVEKMKIAGRTAHFCRSCQK